MNDDEFTLADQPGSPSLVREGRWQAMQTGYEIGLILIHINVLILIYIKYTKKCGFDNYAALVRLIQP